MKVYYNSTTLDSKIPENSAALSDAVNEINSSQLMVQSNADGQYYNVKFQIEIVDMKGKTDDELLEKAQGDYVKENKIGTEQVDWKTFGNVASETGTCTTSGTETGSTQGLTAAVCTDKILSTLKGNNMDNNVNRKSICAETWKHEIGHLLGLDDKYLDANGGIMRASGITIKSGNGTVDINNLEKSNVQIMVDNMISGRNKENAQCHGGIKQVKQLPAEEPKK